jgi:hypothetical protein
LIFDVVLTLGAEAFDLKMTADRLLGGELDQRSLESIQAGTMRYTHRDVPTLKQAFPQAPFDLALYRLLLWDA